MNRRVRLSCRRSSCRQQAIRRRSERRGVLLLVVLSMLVLFLLLGTTFLLTSGQYRTASKIVEKAHRTTFQPADLLERALMQLVRDTNTATSAIRYHSLLRDLYGADGFTAKVHAATPNLTDPQSGRTFPALPRYAGVDQNGSVNDIATGYGRGGSQGQIVELYVQDVRENRLGAAARMADGNAVGLELDSNGLPIEHELSMVAGHYEGCLLTMLAGPCRGQTVRVIGYDPLFRNVNTGANANSPDDDVITVGARFRVMAPRRVDGKPLQFLHPTNAGGVRLVDFSEGSAGFAFIVNGRPFSGSGVGLNAFALSSPSLTQPSPRLSMLELLQNGTNIAMEVALAPNSVYFDRTRLRRLVQTGIGQPLPTDPYAPNVTAANFQQVAATLYENFAGPGGANESYDAPDYQNMALAMQALEPRIRGRVVNAAGVSVDPDLYYPGNAGTAPAYLDLEGVTIPSFHRPDLANFWFNRLWRSSWLQGVVSDPDARARAILEPYNAAGAPQNGLNAAQAAQITAIKRKFMLRPLREDHPDFDGSNPLSRYETTGLRAALTSGRLVNPATNEITFPSWETIGPWDVDNDGDGVNDSVWVDIGLPVQQTEDGRWYKPLVAMLVEDLDGRLNLNAHGSEADLAAPALNRPQYVNDYSNVNNTAVRANLAMDSQQLQNAISGSTNFGWLRSSDQLAHGAGWGVAETSLRPIFATNLTTLDAMTGTIFTGDAQYDDYARLLYGRPDPAAAGRTAALALRESVTFGRYGSVSAGPVFTSTGALYPHTMLTKPGATYVTDSGRTSRQALASVREARTPLEFLGYPSYTGAFRIDGVAEAKNGFSSAPDLRGRLATGLSGAGAPVAEATAEANDLGVHWRELAANSPDDSPYELDLSIAARNMPPASLEEVRRSYYTTSPNGVGPLTAPISDDAPFSAAELERILRAFDGDAEKLPDRLWKTVDAFDPEKLAAQKRLNAHLVSTGSAAGEPTAVSDSLELVVAGAQAAVTRRQVTTDSWDLPSPHENLYDRLVLGADGKPGVPPYPSVGVRPTYYPNGIDDDGDGQIDEDDDGDGVTDEAPSDDDGDGLSDEGDEAIAVYSNNPTVQSHSFIAPDGTQVVRTYNQLFLAGCDDYVVVMRKDPPKNARLTDYLKYRITLELLRSGRLTLPAPTVAALATYHNDIDRLTQQILFGDDVATNHLRRINDRFSFGGLLAPEVLAGRRMDLNRPFGDGRDNNGNGVVDEPDEVGEPYLYNIDPGNHNLIVTNYLDLNKNGRLDQDVNGNGVLYIDTDGDGLPDRFDPGDLVNNNGVPEPIVDHVWVDDNGDGIRQPNEFRPFDYVRGADANGSGLFFDADNDSLRDTNEAFVRDDGPLARQLFARHLYCLMLALTDENYLAPYDSDDPQVLHYLDPLSGRLPTPNDVAPNESSEAYKIAYDLHGTEFAAEIQASTPKATKDHTQSFLPASGNPTVEQLALESRRLSVLHRARQLAQRKLTCKMIAQWAVNVVDFRDPDSIQTAFEYDENPWDGWNVVQAGNDPRNPMVYPIDGDLTTDENWSQRRTITAAGFSAPTPTNEEIAAEVQKVTQVRQLFPLHYERTRGVVWGAERPEVLLTEGVAWHDRRLEDLRGDALLSQSGSPGTTPPKPDGKLADVSSTDYRPDYHLDQLRLPKGYAFLEATNPWRGDDQRPAELYSHVNRKGQVTPSQGVRLDRLSNGVKDPSPSSVDSKGRNRTHSPVWRIAVVEEHPLVRNTTVARSYGATQADPGIASDDPLLNKSSGNAYLDNGPWQYSGDPTKKQFPFLNAYSEYYSQRLRDSRYSLDTTVDLAAGFDVRDADGVGVSAGVIERPPTVPDTSFPAFDSFAQPYLLPSDSKSVELSINSEAEGYSKGDPKKRFITRGVLKKPTTYVERAFYMAAADQAPNPSSSSKKPYPTANPTNPGLWVPELSYEVSIWLQGAGELNFGKQNLARMGVVSRGARIARVHASKFATAFDRLHYSAGSGAGANRGQSYEDILDANPNASVGFAPLIPGRRAVIGTTGDVYAVTAPEADPDLVDLANPFDGPVAKKAESRYATVMSQALATSVNLPILLGPKGLTQLRRFELIPNPDPEQHQFAIRMNGLNESRMVQMDYDNDGNYSEAFNLTGGQATGVATDALSALDAAALMAAPPVIAIPIDHLSISEPLDEYLVRQIELDPTFSRYPWLNYMSVLDPDEPAEDHYRDASGKFSHFDEPFDVLPELIKNQTTPNYRSVHLERLANPLLPWNPTPMRPDGKANLQHDPALPVNPYLPVDARSLDLTAFNSYSDAEKDLKGNSPPQGEVRGPEFLHQTKRSLDETLDAFGQATKLPAISFASNERERPLGPFPLLWMMEPARLLWKQSGGSTISEFAHNAAQRNNGYRSRIADKIVNRNSPANSLGVEGTLYDGRQINETPYSSSGSTPYNPNQFVDVAWRLTLGFSDWMWGEFQTGSGLAWYRKNAPDGPVESVDLNGDAASLDFSGSPEINTANDTQRLLADGRTAAVGAANIDGKNARTFMESYLRSLAAEQATTPEFSWPNRPLASAGELLQVPVWGGSRMLTYYSVFNWQYTQNPNFDRRTQVNTYDGEAQVFHDGLDYTPGVNSTFDGDFANDGANFDTVRDLLGNPFPYPHPQEGSTNVLRFRDMLGHFGHLMNFFQTARFPSIAQSYDYLRNGVANPSQTSRAKALVPQGAAHFYRLLDYVCVPSRFTATDTILNIDAFDDAAYAIGDSRKELAAPFNRIDNYREPGRVNLNTVVGHRDPNEPQRRNPENADGSPDTSRTVPRLPDYWSEVYDGLMHRLRDESQIASGTLIKQGHLGPAWRDVALSRRGYVQPTFNPAADPTDVSLTLASPQQNQVDYSPMRLHPDFPTLFANPFRAPGEGANVPLAHMVQTGVDATMLRAHPLSPGADGAWGRRGVDARTVNKSGSGTNPENNGNRNDASEAGSLPMQIGNSPALGVVDRLNADTVLARFILDPMGVDTNRRGALPDTFLNDSFRASTGANNSALNPRSVAPQSPLNNTEIAKRSTVVPLFSGASLEPSLDTERNSTQRYMPIQRMANLATTRSNVYAVWITVGFFEVKQAKDDARIASRYFNTTTGAFLGANAAEQAATQDLFFRVYPEGWTLGEEIGRDTGEDVRHRGFYVVDRSRPVAFKPGEDANVSDTILVRRRIQ